MKREWDPVTLNAVFWEGPGPTPGDGLRTRTGRQYLIQQVIPRAKYTALKCVVLPKDADVDEGHRFFNWEWNARR